MRSCLQFDGNPRLSKKLENCLGAVSTYFQRDFLFPADDQHKLFLCACRYENNCCRPAVDSCNACCCCCFGCCCYRCCCCGLLLQVLSLQLLLLLLLLLLSSEELSNEDKAEDANTRSKRKIRNEERKQIKKVGAKKLAGQMRI